MHLHGFTAIILFTLLMPFHQALAMYMPQFDVPEVKGENQATISRFRVLIFPHTGTYSTPQEKESILKSVTVSSTKGCTPYSATLDSNQEWVKDKVAGKAAKQILLNQKALAKAVNQTLYYACASDFTVHREKDLKSFSYPGDFVAINTIDGVQIVNIVAPDLYLKGVVPSESLPKWPLETLKAQAVAARTYASWTAVNARKTQNNFDMDDTIFYQAYLGTYSRTPMTDKATDETKGLVLKYNGSPIKAYFSADSGGFTEDARYVFEEQVDYIFPAKAEEYVVNEAQSSWKRTIELDSIAQVLVKNKILPENVKVIDVSVDPKRTPGGRAYMINVKGSDQKAYTIKATDLRYAIRGRSTAFDVRVEGKNLIIDGKGFGHGVGMAQVGALEYVRQLHWTYEQILNFYYPNTDLTQN